MLGHNVEYANNQDDKELMKTARDEGRILLTRDVELYKQAIYQDIDAFLIEGKNETDRLASLSKRFRIGLELNPSKSRCPKCNARIRPTSKDEIEHKIPSSTKIAYGKFWECPKCEKVYWQGAHWKRIAETLNNAKKISAED
jgi:uncharacterized protein with PIN domain